MPTGYTAKVEDGDITEVKDYILSCSRAFGALIHMREDSSEIEIKDRIPSTYYKEQLEKTQKELEAFKLLTDDEIKEKIKKSHLNMIEEYSQMYKNGELKNKTYDKMLNKVKLWIPPTDEHIELKKFAINQIEISKSDFHLSYKDKTPDIVSVEGYKSEMITYFNDNIIRYNNMYKEELEKCEENNKWIKDLVDSF